MACGCPSQAPQSPASRPHLQGLRSPPASSATQGAEDKTTQTPRVYNTAADTDGEDAENGGAQANDVQEEDVKVQQDQDDEASAPVEDEEVPWGPHGLN